MSGPEWMLQSEQVSDAQLIDFLLLEYLTPLLRMEAYLIDQDKAHTVVTRTVAKIVLDRRHYWGQQSVTAWVYETLIQKYYSDRPIQMKPAHPEASLTLILRYLANLDASEISRILHLPVDTILEQLERERWSTVAQPPELPSLEHAHFRRLTGQMLGGDSLPSGSLVELERHFSSCIKCKTYAQESASLDQAAYQLWKERFPSPTLSTDELEAIRHKVGAHLSNGQWRKRLMERGKELALITAGLLAGIYLIWAAGRPGAPNNLEAFISPSITPSPSTRSSPTPPQEIMVLTTQMPGVPWPDSATIPNRQVAQFAYPSSLLNTPTPVFPAPTIRPLPSDPHAEDIDQRLWESWSTWNTLYANALIYDYGPRGYIGPPQVYQNRVWAARPGLYLAIGGPISNEDTLPNDNLSLSPDYFRLWNEGSVYEIDLKTNQVNSSTAYDILQLPVSPAFDAQHGTYAQRNQLYGFYLQTMLFSPGQVRQEGRLVEAGQVLIAGRETIILNNVVDGTVHRQVWMDAQTGLLLAWREYGGQDFSFVRRDIFLTDIQFDLQFPNQFFAYQPSGTAPTWFDFWTPMRPVEALRPSDFQPAMRHHPDLSQAGDWDYAPSGFDPAGSQLSFQYWPSGPGQSSRLAGLLAGRYFLGRVPLGDPWNLLCERSPNGRLLGVIDGPDLPFYLSKSMRWFSLDDPTTEYDPLPDGTKASDLSFSPDSRYMAFYGCGGLETGSQAGGSCSVYIHDTQTHVSRPVFHMAMAGYFAWKPDGTQLAFIGTQSISNLMVYVLDVKSEKIVYSGPFNFSNMAPDPSSPTFFWGVTFPRIMGGLEDCESPH